jgi:toxin FitB
VARVVLDTDVASLSYKGRLPIALAKRLVGQEVCVTFVTIGELARWAEKRRWEPVPGPSLWTGWAALLSCPTTNESRGNGASSASRRGRARPINDTWIAACCLIADLPLATLNLKDFEDFAEHDGLRLISPSES